MTGPIRDCDLEGYLDEALPVEAMVRVERALREKPSLKERLADVSARRDAGVHTIGEIWRENRISCPTREQLGSYLLGVVEDEFADYIAFHIETAGCRFCQANLDDLQAQRTQPSGEADARRRKYFQSSAGHLRAKR